MATTSTAFAPAGIRFGYIGQNQDFQMPIPRAELLFVINAGAITLAASAEDQDFSISCLLPEGYGYVLSDCSAYLQDAEVGDIADWSASMHSFLSNSNNADAKRWFAAQRIQGGDVVGVTSVIGTRAYQLVQASTKIIIPIAGNSGQLKVTGFNSTVDGGPMTLYFLAKFLEFDLNQSYHWAVNTPWPVR